MISSGFADSFVLKNKKIRQELDVETMITMFNDITQDYLEYTTQNKFVLFNNYLTMIKDKTHDILQIRETGRLNGERISKSEFYIYISQLLLEYSLFHNVLFQNSTQNQNARMDGDAIALKFLKLATEPPLLS